MIVIGLNGGIGNQLFQYAFGRKLSIQFNTALVLDVSSFEKDTLRKYSLSPFSVKHRAITNKDRMLFEIDERNGIEDLAGSLLKWIYRPVVIKEKQFNYDADVLKRAKKNTHLIGYWQSEKYFSDIRTELLQDFTIKHLLENKNKEFAKHITSANSVSLHIRRGDYISNPVTNNYHGTCGMDYYAKAIETIVSKIPNPVIFIFSDDLQWTKNNFNTDFETIFVDANKDETAHEDLRLMSLCKHNIIANSSFSWWGAWLNQNKDKIVLAPQKWFNDSSINTQDLIPSSWIRI